MLKNEPRRYDVVALRDSLVACISRTTFQWLLDNSIPFNRFLLHQLNERLGQFIGRVEMDRNAQPMVAMDMDVVPVAGLRLGQLVSADAFAEAGRVVGKITGISIAADGKSITQKITVERPA